MELVIMLVCVVGYGVGVDIVESVSCVGGGDVIVSDDGVAHDGSVGVFVGCCDVVVGGV